MTLAIKMHRTRTTFCAGVRAVGGYCDDRLAKLVFDIETTAQPAENFDAVQQEYLFRDAENLPDREARLARRMEIQRQFSLWPFTGQVVCIAMANADTCRG